MVTVSEIMRENKYYTISKSQDYVDDNGFPRSQNDSDKVYAKAVNEIISKNILDRTPSNFRFYVKIEPNRSLYDPLCRNSVVSNKPSFVDKVCKSENSFMEVNQSVFDKYINYLKTENSRWLVDAQREVK